MVININYAVSLAGWTMRDFSFEELSHYLEFNKPGIFEISKNLVSKNISIKKLYTLIKEQKRKNNFCISYAGTTDFTQCSGLSFVEYLNYLAVQVAQARFITADYFRVLIGVENDVVDNIVERLNIFSQLISPMKGIIEIHGGWEASLSNIQMIIKETNYDFLIDFQNILKSGLSYEQLSLIVPYNRIAYYHCRNLGSSYIEDPRIEKEKEKWFRNNSREILWEPKDITKEEIIKLLR